MKKRVIAMLMCATMVSASFVGCSKDNNNDKKETTGNATTEPTKEATDAATDAATDEATDEATKEAPKEIKHFKAFFDRTSFEINDDNDIKQLIAEKIGADCKETWLTGQEADEANGMLIASGEYPDFINGNNDFIEAGALVPVDEYLDNYPLLKAFWNDIQWDSLRQDDGHIYTIPQFDNIMGKPMDTQQNGEAFWIQTKVLKWDNYPVVESLDQLFDLLERYYEANPKMEDGSDVIPFEILAYDWTYFCLENPPQFLDGYPNNGRCIVDVDTKKVIDYNTTDTAHRYFKKLNEEYKKKIIDQEFMTMSRDQFGEKVASGRVCCFVEQHWDFQTNEDAIKAAGMYDSTYVPLGITIEPGMKEMYYTSNTPLILTGGLGVTTSCKDPEGAFQFINDLLLPEIKILRGWGVKDVDYCVDDNGIFYMTQEMRDRNVGQEYKQSHLCPYSYFPNYNGLLDDGINAVNAGQQPGEFYDGLKPEVQECLAAYNAKTYVDMLDKNFIDPMEQPWYPIWSWANTLTGDTPENIAWTKMEATKQEWLPKVVIADDFEATWNQYLKAYADCKPEDFMAAAQKEVDDRVAFVEKYK